MHALLGIQQGLGGGEEQVLGGVELEPPRELRRPDARVEDRELAAHAREDLLVERRLRDARLGVEEGEAAAVATAPRQRDGVLHPLHTHDRRQRVRLPSYTTCYGACGGDARGAARGTHAAKQRRRARCGEHAAASGR